MTPYRWVDAGKAEDFPRATACAVAHVTRSAYYDWLDRSSGPTEVEWDEASWSVTAAQLERDVHPIEYEMLDLSQQPVP